MNTLFKGITKKEGIQATRPGECQYLQGNFEFVVKINQLKFKQSMKGGNVFILEGVIEESNSPSQPKGTMVQFLENYTFKEKGDQRVAQLIVSAAGGGYTLQDVTPEVVQKACGTDQPLAGSKVRVSTQAKPTKKGGTFTEHFFAAVK